MQSDLSRLGWRLLFVGLFLIALGYLVAPAKGQCPNGQCPVPQRGVYGTYGTTIYPLAAPQYVVPGGGLMQSGRVGCPCGPACGCSGSPFGPTNCGSYACPAQGARSAAVPAPATPTVVWVTVHDHFGRLIYSGPRAPASVTAGYPGGVCPAR